MDYRIKAIIHVLGLYSLAYLVATIYYQINSYPSETPFLPFVEGLSLMFVTTIYIFLGLVTGRIQNKFYKMLLWTFLVVIILVTILLTEAILLMGGFLFGLPAIPLSILTLGVNSNLAVLAQSIVAVVLISLSFTILRREKANKF